MEAHRLRVLTVGDGDLTLSLALVRCYGVDHLDVTASSILPTPEALIATYPLTAPDALQELHTYNVNVLYNVDACLLDQYPFPNTAAAVATTTASGIDETSHKPFDMVLFQHPHLGDYHADEMDLLQRHISLLAHYLNSASSVADYVHVTLCVNQAESWRLIPSATRAGWTLATQVAVQHPFHQIFPPHMKFPWSMDAHWQSSYTNTVRTRRHVTKASGRHWMGRYGYSHVRTASAKSSLTAAPMLAGSVHYVFARDATSPVDGPVVTHVGLTDESTSQCWMCHASFSTNDILQAHFKAPAMPVMEQCNDVTVPSRQALTCYDRDTKRAKNESTPGRITEMESLADTSNALVVDSDAIDIANAIWTVSVDHVGKRLRWYLQHVVGAPVALKRSKREWDQMLKQQRVTVNGDIVTDSSRILQLGWNVALVETSGIDTATDFEVSLDLVAQWSRQDIGALVVVWKPVGMRAIGSFDLATLEESFSRQQLARTGVALKYACLSKLDKGCSGLCLLQPSNSSSDWHNVTISHTFTALVHGCAKEWKLGTSIQLPLDGIRRWKKPAQAKEEVDPDFLHAGFEVHVVCQEQTTQSSDTMSSVPLLSTVSITTTSSSSRLAQAMAYYLRKTSNRPVVGDRIAVQEYLSLPRAMRNRLKQRFCIGCTRIAVMNRITGEHNVETFPIPQKWSAQYWQQFCTGSPSAPLLPQSNGECLDG